MSLKTNQQSAPVEPPNQFLLLKSQDNGTKDKTHRHIILPLSGVPIKIAFLIVRRNAIQRIAHIGANIVIPVLVQRERTAGMLDEQIQHADLVVTDLGQFGEDVVGDEVGAAAARGESEVFLEPGHCYCVFVV